MKIPLGALTAVLGLVLMSGGFVPGLSALDTSAQILAWALVFGFSQQLLTRLVDQRGRVAAAERRRTRRGRRPRRLGARGRQGGLAVLV